MQTTRMKHYKTLYWIGGMLLLCVFFLKGLLFETVIPIFHGTDEYIHYSTVQHFSEPHKKTWGTAYRKPTRSNTKIIELFNYTEEIRAFGRLSKNPDFAGSPYNTPNWNAKTISSIESEMRSGKHFPHFDLTPPLYVHKSTLAHNISANVEKANTNKDFFHRFYTNRIAMIAYGLITVISAFFIARWAGLKDEHSLLIAVIVAFQPQLTSLTSSINYDGPLIATSSVFILATVSIMRHKLNIFNTSLLLIAVYVSFLIKAIGGLWFIAMIGILLWGLRERCLFIRQLKTQFIILIAIVVFGMLFIALPDKHTTQILSNISIHNSEGVGILESIGNYLDGHVFDEGKSHRTSTTYWGTFGWLDTTMHESVYFWIRQIEHIAYFGLFILVLYWNRKQKWFRASFSWIRKKVKYLFTNQKIKRALYAIAHSIWSKKDHIPKAKYLILFMFLILLLQIGVRFYDWQGLYLNGEGVGTPGRYFLPTLIPHIILLVVGLGMFVKNSRAFGLILKTLLVGMVTLNLYVIFLIIIPRYYL